MKHDDTQRALVLQAGAEAKAYNRIVWLTEAYQPTGFNPKAVAAGTNYWSKTDLQLPAGAVGCVMTLACQSATSPSWVRFKARGAAIWAHQIDQGENQQRTMMLGTSDQIELYASAAYSAYVTVIGYVY